MAAQTAQAIELGATLPAVSDRKARQPTGSKRARHARCHQGAGHPVPVAGDPYPHTTDQHADTNGGGVIAAIRAAPDAMKVARPVRRAARGNGPRAIWSPQPPCDPYIIGTGHCSAICTSSSAPRVWSGCCTCVAGTATPRRRPWPVCGPTCGSRSPAAQGTEMDRHLTITETLGGQVYFCDSASAWQRGTN